MPKDWFGYGVKILFSLNLLFSYPLVLYPAHIVIENILYENWPKSRKRQISKNISRTVLVGITVVLTLAIGKKLDKFLSIVGSLTCTPIAFTFPALFHLKACAETPKQKAIDMTIIVLSFVILFFCTFLGFYHWGDPEP